MKQLRLIQGLRNRSGTYILEAVIVMPVFIAAVIALMSLVPIAATCENMVFAVSDEMRAEALKSAFRENPAALPACARLRVLEENPKLNRYQTVFYRYLYEDEDMEDLFQLTFEGEFSQKSPAAVFNSVVFSGKVTARAFTGKLHKEPPVPGDQLSEEDKLVYIFPEWGMRYHGKSCTYVKASCQMVYLSQDTKKGYAPCTLCNASSAQLGSPVFCFTKSGSVYHLAECRIVERYYVEIQRKDAVAKGYSPCSKCGGG